MSDTGRGFLRLAALLGAVLSVCLILSACEKKESGEKPEETSEEALADEYLDTALPTATYDGAAFGVVGSTHTEINPGEEENAEPVHDALLRRNLKIAERYDADFTYYELPGYENVCESVEAATLADEHIYDLVYGVFSGVGTYLVSNELVMSTDNIPHLNLTERWWSQDCMDQLTIHNKTLFLTGMIAYEHCVDGSCLFFNKKLAEDKALDNHFDDVRAYRWTIDKMYENAKAVAHDDNGDTQMSASDTWGFTGDGTTGFAFMASCNIRPVEFDEEDTPSVVQSPGNELFTKVDTLRGILSNHRYCACWAEEQFSETEASFVKNKALYRQGLCQQGASDFRPADFYDFGIIPDPMWNEEQGQYYSFGYTWSGGGIYFPICGVQEEMTGVLTEALAYQSSVENGYYYAIIEKYIKGKGTYDYDSEEMVDLILSSKVYDLSNLFMWGISNAINDSIQGYSFFNSNISANLSSLWAGQANACRSQCRQTIRLWDRAE